MKRKILILAMAALLTFSCLAFVACGNNTTNKQLSYGKKYLRESYLNDDNTEEYYLFNDNGTGLFHYYNRKDYSYYDEPYITSYSIKFKYVIDADSEVVYCFYDSLEYDEAHNGASSNYSTWTSVLTFTDNFLYTIESYPTFYFTEQFLSDYIPNFGNK